MTYKSAASSLRSAMNAEPVVHRLRTADRVWRRGLAFEWLLRTVKWGCAAVLLCVGLDLMTQLGSWPRLVLTILLGGAALGLAGIFIRRGGRLTGPLPRIARVLESRDPALGTKLMNVLQLEEQANDAARPELTRQLARQAVAEASENLKNHEFLPLLKSDTLRRSLLHAVLPVLVMIGLALAFSSIAYRQLQRFLDPFGDHPPFSFTQLVIVTPHADGEGVIYRRPVTVEAEYAGHRPEELFMLITSDADPSRETVVPMLASGEKQFVQEIGEVTSALTVRVATADRRSISQARRIPVILTPQLEKATLTIEPPAYTREKNREVEIGLGKGAPPALSTLTGSTLKWTLRSNRPLGPGTVGLQGAAAQRREEPLSPGVGDESNVARAAFAVSESGRLTFDLRDTGGLQTDHELAAALTVTHDLPPRIEIVEPAQDGFIVENFEAKLVVSVSDDYGIRSTRLHLGLNGTWRDPEVVTASQDPPPRTGREALTVQPSALGAKAGDKLEFFGEVTDIRPEPQLARTRTLTLGVISEEQYNDLLRAETEVADLEEKYATLHDELDRLVARQRELAEAAEKAEQAAKEGKKSEPEEREKLEASQKELNGRLEELARKMETAVREKPLYDMEKSLGEVLKKEAEAIRGSIAQNQRDTPATPTPGQLAKTGQEQADRLDPQSKEGREQIQKAIADAQKMQEMLKPLAAFRELYEEQKDLASQSRALRDKPELSMEDKLSLQEMASRERGISEALKEVAKQLREAADGARETYPAAAADAENIAQSMEAAGLDGLADRASRSMLAARQAESHDRADHLREEMEKMMPECQSCQGGMGQAFQQRLSLARGMLAGRTFEQMAMCRKFGFGRNSGGMGGGTGGGFAMGPQPNGAPQRSLLGGESRLGRRESAMTSTSQARQGTPSPGAARTEGLAVQEQATTAPAPGRTSDSLPEDASADGYTRVVDAYFRKLTQPTPSPSPP